MSVSLKIPTPILLGLPLAGLGLVLGDLPATWKAGTFNVLAMGVLGLAVLEALDRARQEPAWARFWKPYAGMLLVIALLMAGMTLRLLSQGVALPRPPLAWFLAWGLFTLLAGALMLTVTLPNRQKGMGHTTALDAAIFAVTFLLLIWIVGLRDVEAGPLGQGEKAGLLLVTTGLACTLGLSAHALWEDRRLLWGPFGLFQAVLIVVCLVNLQIFLLFMKGTFSQEHPLRLGAGALALALVALVPRVSWTAPDQAGTWGWLEDVLPNLPALAALAAFALDFARRGTGDLVGGLLLVVAFVLVLARQAAIFLELRTFQQSLGARVEEQTRDLAQSQDLLLRTQRMNLVATLGAGLAHDVNNFIGASLLYSQLLEEEGPALETGPSKDLARLREALVRAGELTQRLMGFTEETGGTSRILDLNHHLLSQSSLLHSLVPRTLTLEVRPAPGSLPIRAKPTFLDQVVVNLVSNARDATPRGGRITLSLRKEAGRAVLEVVDTGCGMPLEVQARIFEPFYTTKPPGKGTGLGLSAVGRLVEELGGHLDLLSEVGVGTTFRLSFKLEEAFAKEGS